MHCPKSKCGPAGGTGIDEFLVDLGRLDRGRIRHPGLELVIDHQPVIRRQVHQPARRNLVAGLRALRQPAHARFLFLHRAGGSQHVVVGFGRCQIVLGKDVFPIRKHAAFGAVGDAVQLGAGAGQIAPRTADEAKSFEVGRDNIVLVVVLHGERIVGEQRRKFGQEIALDVFGLPHDDVDDDVVVTLRFRHLQHLGVLHAQILHFVELDLDSGRRRELRDQLLGDVEMGMRRPVDDDGLAFELRPVGAGSSCRVRERKGRQGRSKRGFEGRATCNRHRFLLMSRSPRNVAFPVQSSRRWRRLLFSSMLSITSSGRFGKWRRPVIGNAGLGHDCGGWKAVFGEDHVQIKG